MACKVKGQQQRAGVAEGWLNRLCTGHKITQHGCIHVRNARPWPECIQLLTNLFAEL